MNDEFKLFPELASLSEETRMNVEVAAWAASLGVPIGNMLRLGAKPEEIRTIFEMQLRLGLKLIEQKSS